MTTSEFKFDDLGAYFAKESFVSLTLDFYFIFYFCHAKFC
jgi:hypothetical protein